MRLQSAEQKNALLSKQLSEARSRLLVAETEVERLSSIIENRTSVRTTRAPNAPATRAAAPAVAAPAAQRQAPAVTSQRDSDMPFVTVMVDKANLRLGPNTSDSPVMTVSRGTRLTVETRQGPWFRVYAPNGNRLWVSADVVAFGKDAMSSPSETVRIRAVGGSKVGDNFRLP